MTLLIIVLILAVMFLFLAWRLTDGSLEDWQEKAKNLEIDNTEIRTTLTAVLNKTVQVVLTDMQIEQIAFIVSDRLKEDKKWLN